MPEFVTWCLTFIESKSVKVEQCVVQKDVNLISLILTYPIQELIHSVPKCFAEVSLKKSQESFFHHYTPWADNYIKKELKP